MSKVFATGFERPLAWEGYPITLGIAIHVQQELYFERVYLDGSGNQLAIRATLIAERGLLWLTDFGPFPPGTKRIEVCVRNSDRSTEPDPIRPLIETQRLPSFATGFDVPKLFGDYPLQLSMAIGTRQVVYLERVYKDQRGNQISIRSDIVYDRMKLVGFNIHVPAPPPGTKRIEVCLTNQYRATEFTDTLEYNVLEYNELEYN